MVKHYQKQSVNSPVCEFIYYCLVTAYYGITTSACFIYLYLYSVWSDNDECVRVCMYA